MDSEETFLRTRKKPTYPVSRGFADYLAVCGRQLSLPVSYSRLEQFAESAPLWDAEGRDTLWETVIFPPEEMRRLSLDLTQTYALLKAEGDMSVMQHLYADRIDYCSFGNSKPFRIRIVNSYNDNQDYYYIKKADASRIYGLELEHLLSPNRMHYLVEGPTLVEEHVVGIPGDVFIKEWLYSQRLNEIRVAKELVKFNERCFVRLLGDMRSYNFVVDVTPDFEGVQIRIRAMDFDQQSYSGRMNFYRPQFFKENNELVFYCTKHINPLTAAQYQREEHSLIFRRMQTSLQRLQRLLTTMEADTLSDRAKIRSLRSELAEHFQDSTFNSCNSMGSIVRSVLTTIEKSVRRNATSAFTPHPTPFSNFS